jgi:hypothetical protein
MAYSCCRVTHTANTDTGDLHTAQVPPVDKLSSNVHNTLGLGVGHDDLGTINREAGHLPPAHVCGDVFRFRSSVSYCAFVSVHFEQEVK